MIIKLDNMNLKDNISMVIPLCNLKLNSGMIEYL